MDKRKENDQEMKGKGSVDTLRAVGIIAEYNPFHNGHKYHLQQSMEKTGADVSVAVISGNFTQRGELAVLDKWTRAEMAVRNGVDLVVEMPVLFACNNAGYFARGGVEILENLGAEWISFGSESGNIDRLLEISQAMKSHADELNSYAGKAVKEGLSYPRARQEALIKVLSETCSMGGTSKDPSEWRLQEDRDELEEILIHPNNLLALEYLKTMRTAEPITVRRQGSGYYELEPKGSMASATGIRKMLAQGEDISRLVPDITREILMKHRRNLGDEEKLFTLLAGRILMSQPRELNHIFGAEEGLGNKMKNNIRYWKSYEDILEGLKSKRYTRTRIGRLLAMTLMGTGRTDVKQAQNYIRVLAFDEKGGRYLKQVKKSNRCMLPVLTNLNKELTVFPELERTIAKDILASDLYNLACGKDLYENSDYVKMPVRIV